MRVLIADKLLPSTAEALRTVGCEVTESPSLKDSALVRAIADTRARHPFPRLSTPDTLYFLCRDPTDSWGKAVSQNSASRRHSSSVSVPSVRS